MPFRHETNESKNQVCVHVTLAECTKHSHLCHITTHNRFYTTTFCAILSCFMFYDFELFWAYVKDGSEPLLITFVSADRILSVNAITFRFYSCSLSGIHIFQSRVRFWQTTFHDLAWKSYGFRRIINFMYFA